MSVQVECPNCRTLIRIEERLLGTRIRCDYCNRVFVSREDSEDDLPPMRDRYDYDDRPRRSGRDKDSGKAVASMILGIVGMFGWCLPIIGLPVTITGLVLGIKGLSSRNHGMSVAGVVLSIVGLLLSVANAAIGAYLGATGQHPLFNFK